jgi:hypothetical protein
MYEIGMVPIQEGNSKMQYVVEEYLAGCWFVVRTFPTRQDAEGFAEQVGGNFQIRLADENKIEEEYLVD